MNGSEVLRLVDSIRRDKNIDEGIVFEGIEAAIAAAGLKHYGEEEDVQVKIDRGTGDIAAQLNSKPIPQDELGDLLGRIAAQQAKQVMIQKIREAERDALHAEFDAQRNDIVSGTITRVDPNVCTVNLGKVEAILPRSEQIPGEQHRVNERVRATVLDVRKQGSRVKIVLSRAHPEFVHRLFEIEIPEVTERIIEVRSLAREAGYRSKVAVSCYDSSIDAVGACVGVRGSRIKNVVEELAGERIDIIRWNDSLNELIPNAMQPAEVDDVILCPMLGRVIVLVQEDQLSLAIGKKGQNVRLASKLVGWDIDVMTQEELDQQLDGSVHAFSQAPHVTEELAESLVSQGFFSFEDLSVIEPDNLEELSGLGAGECDEIIAYADREAEREEEQQEEKKRQRREQRQLEAIEDAAREAAKAAGVVIPELQKADEEAAAAAAAEEAASNGEASGEAAGETAEAAPETAAATEDTNPAAGDDGKDGTPDVDPSTIGVADAQAIATEDQQEDPVDPTEVAAEAAHEAAVEAGEETEQTPAAS